ncbi:ANTAR domain-containing response regulator [Thalassovita aquimarina]|uniref:ANTAR domain-containing response regulator n=1 Tax=Thalassovita aquimarina TaxID=2785917 RepID=UPI003569B2FB
MTYSFAGMKALVLHPSAEVRDGLEQRLATFGVRAEGRWPELVPGDESADLLVVDIDRGENGQFPWGGGAAPMPVVGLIGSETPGRLQWAIDQGLDAFLPQGATAKLYSALVLGFARHAERAEIRRREAEAGRRATLRLELVQAVIAVMRDEGIGEAQALKQLRAFAMVERVALEDAARLYLSDVTKRGQA